MFKVGNYLIANVYLPCSGTDNRLLIIQDLLADIWSWRERFNSCEFIIAGDLNVDLDSVDTVANYINSFLNEHSLFRCDLLAGKAKTATYVNDALNHHSTIDYVITSVPDIVIDFEVIDPDVNFSDHLPIMASCRCSALQGVLNSRPEGKAKSTQLRWDYADLMSYYHDTGLRLQPLLTETDQLVQQWNNCIDIDYGSNIDVIYNNVVRVLIQSAKSHVPQHRKNFYKFGGTNS